MSTTTTKNELANHPVVSHDEWMKAGAELLAKEKEFTKLRDQLSRQRRDMPWVKVEKDYIFQGEDGPVSLKDLFGKNSQLIVYHFMYAPGWEEGCPGCSFVSDHIDGALLHMAGKDVSYAAISRAKVEEFLDFKHRMGWKFTWVSSAGNDFSYDFNASFRPEDLQSGPVNYNFKLQPLKSEDQPGLTVFYKDEDGTIYRTYSSYERGVDMLLGTYNLLDLTPKGRDESSPMNWVKYHDQYGS